MKRVVAFYTAGIAMAILAIGSLELLSAKVQGVPQSPGYQVSKRLSEFSGGDMLAIDSVNRRLYGMGDKVGDVVLDIDDLSVAGRLPRGGGHSYALAPSLGMGLTRNGLLFDLKTLQISGLVPNVNGDEMSYDQSSGRVFVFATTTLAVDVAKGSITDKIEIGTSTEAGIADKKGRVYVNLPKEKAIAVINSRDMKIEARWPLSECAPGAVSMDEVHDRLFVSCSHSFDKEASIYVLDSQNGRVDAVVPLTGQEFGAADQIAFDPQTQLLFCPSESGKLIIVHEDTPNRYSIVQRVDVSPSHDNLALDPVTHRVFLYSLRPGALIVLDPGPQIAKIKGDSN